MIGIEASHYRIVNDDLDPILVESIFLQLIECQDIQTWQVVIEQTSFYIAPVVFDKPYFWQILHKGDAQYSRHYADIYMGYLSSIWGKKLLLQRLWQAYLMAIQGKCALWYWQKQWFWAVLGTTHDEKDNQPNQQAWFDVVDGYLSNISKRTI